MWGMTTIVGAFALALIMMSLTFMGGAVVVAVPLAIIGVAITGFVDFNRRRKRAQSIHAFRAQSESDVEFTERDRQTLIPE
jgi:UDP-N-acetylmuramyl pentapeptide phosphotransferase/UDP-N-acetylglucosamine-1-phosphate transferase